MYHQEHPDRTGRRARPAWLYDPAPARDEKITVPYGHSVTIHGLFTTSQDVPLPGQSVDIYAALDNYTDAFHEVGTAITAPDGSWTATLPPGPSRIIRAVTSGTATILPSTAQVTAIVPAKVRFSDFGLAGFPGVALSASSESSSAATSRRVARWSGSVSGTARRSKPTACKST